MYLEGLTTVSQTELAVSLNVFWCVYGLIKIIKMWDAIFYFRD